MAYTFYPLPPSLKLCESVDSSNTRYLNQMHTPLINPLKKALDIELYNEKWFNKPLHTSTPKLVNDHDTLHFPDASLHAIPSVSELHRETDICSPTPSIEPDDYSLPPPLLLLHYIVRSLILIVFSLFVIFLRILLNHVGSLFELIKLKLSF